MTSANKQISGLANGKDVVIYTSRELKTGSDAESSLLINSAVSSFLVDIVKGLTVRPSFFLAKGGITSSDLASKGLSSESALILGSGHRWRTRVAAGFQKQISRNHLYRFSRKRWR